MKTAAWLLILIISPFFARTQQPLVADDARPYNYIVKSSLISFVDQLSFPTVQFGLERKLDARYSLSGELGIQLYHFHRYGVDTNFIRPRGMKASLELRRYVSPRLTRGDDGLSGTYVGINFFYRANRFNNNVFFVKPNDSKNSNDCFWVDKTVWGARFILGVQRELSPRLTLDLFSGIGVMHRTAIDHNREFRFGIDSLMTPIDVNARALYNDASLSEHNGWYPCFNLGIRIGYRF